MTAFRSPTGPDVPSFVNKSFLTVSLVPPHETDRLSAKEFSNMGKRKQVFNVIVERDESGWYVAECPALQACYTQGKTYDAAVENIKDVIALCLTELKAQGKSIPTSPQIIGIQPVEVSV